METLLAQMAKADSRDRPELADRLVLELQQAGEIPQPLLSDLTAQLIPWLKSSNFKVRQHVRDRRQRRRSPVVRSFVRSFVRLPSVSSLSPVRSEMSRESSVYAKSAYTHYYESDSRRSASQPASQPVCLLPMPAVASSASSPTMGGCPLCKSTWTLPTTLVQSAARLLWPFSPLGHLFICSRCLNS
jgi:hypothetical protein